MSTDLATMMHRTDAALAELGWGGAVRPNSSQRDEPELQFGISGYVPAEIAWRAFQVAGIDSACFRCFLWGHENDVLNTGCLDAGRPFVEDCGIEREAS